MTGDATGKYVVLSGGIGGAKLALGLSHVVPAENLTVIVNTGDDFEHFGLNISPDLDTLMYTLAGAVNPETGWGRDDETWQFMEALERLGGETWFRLGDRDLATHVQRSRLLASGVTLSEVTATLCERFGVGPRIVPMSDDPVRTRVLTDDGELEFQHYFVRDRAEPRTLAIRFHGAHQAAPAADALAALRDPALAGIVIAPSNPYLSIDPILAIPGMRPAIADACAPVVAVSPIVGDAAIKGPTAKIMRELELEVSARSIAAHYGDLLDGFIVDETDRDAVARTVAANSSDEQLDVTVCQTVMKSLDDRIELARATLAACATLNAR
jgi:LPPG:FO 2-phospho-L-lactate transferase